MHLSFEGDGQEFHGNLETVPSRPGRCQQRVLLHRLGHRAMMPRKRLVRAPPAFAAKSAPFHGATSCKLPHCDPNQCQPSVRATTEKPKHRPVCFAQKDKIKEARGFLWATASLSRSSGRRMNLCVAKNRPVNQCFERAIQTFQILPGSFRRDRAHRNPCWILQVSRARLENGGSWQLTPVPSVFISK